MKQTTNTADQSPRFSIAYITGNGKIPSYNANSVGVMKICGHLTAMGVPVRLVLPRIYKHTIGGIADVWKFYGVPSFRMIRIPSMPGNRAFFLLSVLYAFAMGINHVHTRNIQVACLAAALRRPVVFESHNYIKAAKHRLFAKLLRHLNNPGRSISLLVTTRASARAYADAGVPPARITVVPNGVEISSFIAQPNKQELRRILDLPQDAIVACYAGSLYEGRGIEDILDCAARQRCVLFMLVGGRPKDVMHYKTIAESNRLENIRFIGHVDQSKVPMYLMASDMLLLTNTSHSNPVSMNYVSPMKMFDYLAAAKPMVVQDFPVLREILADEVNALLVSPGSGEVLSAAITRLIDDRDLAERIAARARLDAYQYAWDRRAQHILSCHESMDAGRRG